MLDVPSYLARINYSGPTLPNIDTLRALHRAHLLTVPFENLDIGLGRKIVTDEELILSKIIEQRRGGFCYELNGAFAALLRALGFAVTLLSARVSREGGDEGPDFDHLTLRVDLEQAWLADVGFGESFIEPLRMNVRDEQVDPAGKFRLIAHAERLQLEKLEADRQWKRQYSFSQEAHTLEDFAEMCRYHQTSSNSSFTQNQICSLATVDGRITLSAMKLIVTRNGNREERMLTSAAEREQILRQHFGISL